ncbi:hypothetical protein niasHT_000902 [Heterodera trifolii]|uniref:Protein tweety homolog n=1 Tax=Heterodera trifolii TaxID=157864 RepID=A0ABD2LR56_9BILA
MGEQQPKTNFADWLLKWTHRVPHFDFRFNRLRQETPFDVDPNGEYAQSLVILCALSLLLALLFLLATLLWWVAQCCLAHRSGTPNRTSRTRIGRLSCALFLVSVLCFALMGACLYGNEHVNKSVRESTGALAHVANAFRVAMEKTHKLNESQWHLSRHIDQLTLLIEQKSKDVINQTMMIREADSLLTELSDKVDELKQRLGRTLAILADTQFLEAAKRKGERVELERWLLCLLLPLIMLSVLFAGVIAFCRQSRKGAIIFSGLGLVIFLVTWLLFSAAFPLTVAYADFCSDGRPFLRTHLNDELIDVIQFYSDCTMQEPNTSPEATSKALGDKLLPGALPLAMIRQLSMEQNEAEHKLEALLARLFNGSAEIESITAQIAAQIITTARLEGAVHSALQCSALHHDVLGMQHGFCRHGFFGSVLISFTLFVLGLSLFILLILVSKSWYIFTRLPNDYSEVDNDDQFSPRGHDAMPDNIYDTNIFNPRARQHLANTSAAESGGMAQNSTAPNGTVTAGTVQLRNSPEGIMQQNAPSWQQQLLTSHANASAPAGTLRLGTLTRNGGAIRTSAGNYQQISNGNINPYGRFQEFGNA